MAQPRLRFDRVATGLVERVRRDVRDFVPAGKTVVFTVTAPIRLPAKTTVAIVERIRSGLSGRSKGLNADQTIYGNRVRITLLPAEAPHYQNAIGIVHNPGPKTSDLIELARAMLEDKT